ncbi:bifunctional 2-polyprenyl-6-hydroxyphenol methylase/3-demethylubiquinol 3-O-methyltransferase UbiG [Streptomyces sp. V3I7]|uniref:class I SAM-dependent methyltransferase n=1 Tax=Streptomyces sp. V3I7 TaxID=3042278 RepID=UPI00278731DA|nr:class I SAM-dependent methyltransferase [Streptomyces sp. V3I7]MDQ0992462.1 SAM-dependent methyltransferase [Streptomyces sp. V3I7]
MQGYIEVDAEMERAMARVTEAFPFPGYFDPAVSGHVSIARTVQRFLKPGSRILDFGAGPADKTAVLAALGYQCTAVDDLQDEWHKRGGARRSILDFAERMGIEYLPLDGGPLPSTGKFDLVMLHDVLEHLHDSPRDLLNGLLERVRDGGYLFVTVPNHVNLRKRLDVLRGRTSHPQFELYYWYPGSWRGHVREYTEGDCRALAKALGLRVREVRGAHHMLCKVPPRFRRAYLAVSRFIPSTRDTWSMVAQKPPGWVAKGELDDSEFRQLTGLKSWGELAH